MDSYLLQILLIIFAYLVGSIPFGFILTKTFKKQNIQELGSGNIGATNVMRVAGKKIGVMTFLLDGFKGLLVVYICFNVFDIKDIFIKNAIVISVVLGHIYPVWLKFKGGKGVATFIMLVAYISPMMFVTMIISWYAFYKMFYIVSLASLVSMISVLAYQISFQDDYLISSVILSALIVYKHADNLKRLLAGNEASFNNSK